MNTNDDKHGLSGLSNLVSDTEQSTQSKAAQNSLRQSAKSMTLRNCLVRGAIFLEEGQPKKKMVFYSLGSQNFY